MTKRPPIYRRPTLGKPFAMPGDERPSAAKRGYGRAWRAIRETFLEEHPRCACGAPATEVDHVISLRRGGTNAPANLRAMCKPCHARKTVAVDGALGHSKNRSGVSTVDPRPHSFHSSTEFMSGFQGVSDDGQE